MSYLCNPGFIEVNGASLGQGALQNTHTPEAQTSHNPYGPHEQKFTTCSSLAVTPGNSQPDPQAPARHQAPTPTHPNQPFDQHTHPVPRCLHCCRLPPPLLLPRRPPAAQAPCVAAPAPALLPAASGAGPVALAPAPPCLLLAAAHNTARPAGEMQAGARQGGGCEQEQRGEYRQERKKTQQEDTGWWWVG